jgi:hypothetical protein
LGDSSLPLPPPFSLSSWARAFVLAQRYLPVLCVRGTCFRPVAGGKAVCEAEVECFGKLFSGLLIELRGSVLCVVGPVYLGSMSMDSVKCFSACGLMSGWRACR